MVQVRVTWSHFSKEVSTWEDYDVLKSRFPDALDWSNQASDERKMSVA